MVAGYLNVIPNKYLSVVINLMGRHNHLICHLIFYSVFFATISIPCLFFFVTQQPLLGLGLLIVEVSRSQSDIPHSVGLLWTSDRPVAETSTWQHTTLTRDRHPCLRRDSNPQSQQACGHIPRLRPRGSWDRHSFFITTYLTWCLYNYKDQQDTNSSLFESSYATLLPGDGIVNYSVSCS
jgi:hypothetical protein